MAGTLIYFVFYNWAAISTYQGSVEQPYCSYMQDLLVDNEYTAGGVTKSFKTIASWGEVLVLRCLLS